MNNGDNLRSMTNKEMSNLFANENYCPPGKFYAESVCHDMSCFDCWDWWLDEEAKNPVRNVIKDDLISDEPVPDSAWTDKIPDSVLHGSFGSFKNHVSK